MSCATLQPASGSHAFWICSACRQAAAFSLVAVLVACLLASALPAIAAEPTPVALFRPDSLAGWEYGPSQAGWQIEEGKLAGAADSQPLLSGFAYQDVTLTGQFRGGVTVELWPIGEGDVVRIRLAEGDAAGKIDIGTQAVATGKTLAARPDGSPHTCQITRTGGELRVTIDDQEVGQAKLPSETTYVLGLAPAGSKCELTAWQSIEPVGEPIFNGTDLTGWWTPGKRESWIVEDGAIVCINKGGNYLRTEQAFGNFTLSLDYKIRKGGNSGVGIRTPRDGWPSGDGMEMQIMDEKPGSQLSRHSTMAIYGNIEPIARNDQSEAWNRLVIKAEGYMISAWVNGALVQQIHTARLPELKHRNLAGWIGFQDHGARVEFKHICVSQRPAGTGLAAWDRARRRSASDLILSRLMNIEEVAINGDPLKTQLELKELPAAPAAQTIAELTGPGAITFWSTTNQAGKLAFYFDGEAKPRIECTASELGKKLPDIVGERQPLVAYIPFAKSLKVTVEKQPVVARYRIEWLKIPADIEITSFQPGEKSLARGLLPALTYRRQQHGWSRIRELEPRPRISAAPRPIKAGERVELLSQTGTGIIEWLRLQGTNSLLLADDCLWLEVTIDGESTPAVSAPARFWFPGLADGKSFENFVHTNTAGGMLTRLAMPYGTSWKLTAINKGAKTLPGVGAVALVKPSTAETQAEIAARPRLRGIYRTASEIGSAPFIDLAGKGRFVGLVAETSTGTTGSPSTPTGRIDLAGITLDGQPLAALEDPGFGTFFGHAMGKGDFTAALSGQRKGLIWRYCFLSPLDFEKRFEMRTTPSEIGCNRLAWFYVEK